MFASVIKSPIARKRLKRFTEIKRAYYSLLIIGFLYLLSLGAELFCNNTPLYVHYKGRSYFPVFRFHPDDTFTGSGKNTRPDYHAVNASDQFHADPDNYMVFPIISHGPDESIAPEAITGSQDVTLTLAPVPRVGTVNIRRDYSIAASVAFDIFLNGKSAEGLKLTEYFPLPMELRQALDQRFHNQPAPAFSCEISSGRAERPVVISLPAYTSRSAAPQTVRLTFRETMQAAGKKRLIFSSESLAQERPNLDRDDVWRRLTKEQQAQLLELVRRRLEGPVDDLELDFEKTAYSAAFTKKDARFPHGPFKGHFLGIDAAGRDVAARILYGLRTSMTFGLLLVFCSYAIGIIAGALQGYFGGVLDITAQRLIEIWSALPFLYIMILMGSVYGRSFALLLFCYGIFNWIGISYYIRGEFLRLRKLPFVEAAKCMGISPLKIIFKHILPNAVTPVITFFPFSLVGAIGSLAALDYLGFGLPPPTPSWGELLYQAQQYRWAWWLILYPSLALFIVMLLGVFVGEGIRNAYDPKRYTQLEG